MVVDVALLNTQHYYVWIKGRVEQSKERRAPSLHLRLIAYEKGTLRLPSTTVANFILLLLTIAQL